MSEVLYTARVPSGRADVPVMTVVPAAEASPTVHRLNERFPGAIVEVTQFRDDFSVTVRPQDLLAVVTFLRSDPDLAFVHLSDLTSQDRSLFPGGSPTRFQTIYHLYAPSRNERLRLKVNAPGGDSPVVPSLVPIWLAANWPEREVYDLMGIKFEGHPDLRRIMMPFDWPNHPLRKDVPRGGETVPYSMIWEDEEFESFGKQILEPKHLAWFPTRQADTNRHMIVNMGPQHPATHGVLRLVVELDGERIVAVYPDLGYLHSGFEKQAESIRYKDFAYYTDRTDYLSAMSNNLSYTLAVEKLMGVEIPRRAQTIRVMMAELSRLASHLMWLGTHVMDLAGMGHEIMMYALRDREQILDIFELVSGARLTLSYIRPGGLFHDTPPSFPDRIRDLLSSMPPHIDEFERMLTENPIWLARTEGVGLLDTQQCLALGITGPLLRATGMPFDYRKLRPYSSYDQYDFDVPTATGGDTMARYLVRIAEMRQSLRILEQALQRLEPGPVWTADRKMWIPPRQELDVSMEAVIHHFKLMTQGFTPPVGEVYEAVEGPRGEHGYYVVSDGSGHPYRCHIRGASFWNLQATHTMAKGQMIADLIAIIGTIDIVLGDVDR